MDIYKTVNNKYVLYTFPEYGTEAYQGQRSSSTQDRRVGSLEFEVMVSAETYFSADRATIKILHDENDKDFEIIMVRRNAGLVNY